MINALLVQELAQAFRETFGQDLLIVRSPQRVNIIGEHADYNEGYVLPATIDKACYRAIAPREDQDIRLVAKDMEQSFSTSPDHIKPLYEREKNLPLAYYITSIEDGTTIIKPNSYAGH